MAQGACRTRLIEKQRRFFKRQQLAVKRHQVFGTDKGKASLAVGGHDIARHQPQRAGATFGQFRHKTGYRIDKALTRLAEAEEFYRFTDIFPTGSGTGADDNGESAWLELLHGLSAFAISNK